MQRLSRLVVAARFGRSEAPPDSERLRQSDSSDAEGKKDEADEEDEEEDPEPNGLGSEVVEKEWEEDESGLADEENFAEPSDEEEDKEEKEEEDKEKEEEDEEKEEAEDEEGSESGEFEDSAREELESEEAAAFSSFSSSSSVEFFDAHDRRPLMEDAASDSSGEIDIEGEGEGGQLEALYNGDEEFLAVDERPSAFAQSGFCNDGFEHSEGEGENRQLPGSDAEEDEEESDDEYEEVDDDRGGERRLSEVAFNFMEDEVQNQLSRVKSVGVVHFSAKHNAKNKLIFEVQKVEFVPAMAAVRKRGKNKLKWSHLQACITLLPEKKQKHRTKMVEHEVVKRFNPTQKNEKSKKRPLAPAKDTTSFKGFNGEGEFAAVTASSLKEGSSSGIRIRVYGCTRGKRSHLLGENVSDLYRMFKDRKTQARQPEDRKFVLQLEERKFALSKLADHSDSEDEGKDAAKDAKDSAQPSAGHSLQLASLQRRTPAAPTAPELFVGLQYDESSGQLQVEIVNACNIVNPRSRKQPSSFVRVDLKWSPFISSDSKGRHTQFKSKTLVQDNNRNPTWQETFSYPISKTHLRDVSLMLQVVCKNRLIKDSVAGWISMGRNSCSERSQEHWRCMLEALGTRVTALHTLLSVTQCQRELDSD